MSIENISTYEQKRNITRRKLLWEINVFQLFILNEFTFNNLPFVPEILLDLPLQNRQIFALGVMTLYGTSILGLGISFFKERKVNASTRFWEDALYDAERTFAVPVRTKKERNELACYCHDRFDNRD